MTKIITQFYHSPVGELVLGSFEDQLCLCNWRDKKNKVAIEKRLFKHFKGSYSEGSNTLLSTTTKQLDEYFNGQRTEFNLPLILAGTEFQKKVWQTLQTIPYGHTYSYLNLAQKLGKDSAVRAVANANAANALSIIIPCHRIIGNNGKLVGYAGGLDTKQRLLTLEQTPKIK
jgi:methylated-DNA-[protein]-cysteine S-methyltransferase